MPLELNGPVTQQQQELRAGAGPLQTPIKRTTHIAGRGEAAFASYNKGQRTISMNSATVSPKIVAVFDAEVRDRVAASNPVVDEVAHGAPAGAV